jgi:hypothetical protein
MRDFLNDMEFFGAEPLNPRKQVKYRILLLTSGNAGNYATIRFSEMQQYSQ